MDRIRLGLLQVNHDRTPEIGDHFADDSHRFRDLFDQLDQRFTYRVYMTEGGEIPASPDEQDAFLITGSPLSVLDDLPWLDPLYRFIRACDDARKPLLGACFGHQAIAVALGGKVTHTGTGYNVGIEDTHFTSHRPWMQPHRDKLPLHVFHEDQVTELPAGCDLLGGSNRCPIGSFAKGNHIFTTQAHPEFTDRFMRALLDFTEDKTDQDLASARASLTRKAEGDVFAEWASKFFKGATT